MSEDTGGDRILGISLPTPTYISCHMAPSPDWVEQLIQTPKPTVKMAAWSCSNGTGDVTPRGRLLSTKPFPSQWWWWIIFVRVPWAKRIYFFLLPLLSTLTACVHTLAHTHTLTLACAQKEGKWAKGQEQKKNALQGKKNRNCTFWQFSILEGRRLIWRTLSVCTSSIPKVRDTLCHSKMDFVCLFLFFF